MEQNDNPSTSLLDDIKEQGTSVKQLISALAGKDIDVAKNSLIAMKSDDYKRVVVNTGATGKVDKYNATNNRIFSVYNADTPRYINIFFCKSDRKALDVIHEVMNVRYIETNDNIYAHAVMDVGDDKIYNTVPWKYMDNRFCTDLLYENFTNILICESLTEEPDENSAKKTFYALVNLVACLCGEFSIQRNATRLIFLDSKGELEDIKEHLGGYFTKEQFFEELENSMQMPMTLDSLVNNYYAK